MTKDSEDTVIVKQESLQRASSEACLVAVTGKELCRRYLLKSEKSVIGRSADCDIVVNEQGVSRFHAQVVRTVHGNRVEDLDSTNGTLVNGVKVRQCDLRDGDQVQIGKAIFKFIESNNLESAYYEEVYRLTTIDDLTRVYNRRHLFQTGEREFARAARHNRPLSMILFDIDYFKKVNDTYGHQSGDRVLQEVANRVSSLCRQEDIFARYGGEEFALLLPEVDARGAERLATRVRESVAGQTFDIGGSQSIAVTVSLGVADIEELRPGLSRTGDSSLSMSQQLETLIKLADSRLYKAKEKGRNCVVAR